MWTLNRSLSKLIAVLCLFLMGTLAIPGSLFPPPAEAAGTDIYVDASATGTGNGLSWSDAFTTLQDALADATSGDEIWVAVGVYYPDEGGGMIDNDPTMSFTLLNGVEIYGGFVGTETIRSQRDWVNSVTVLSGDIAKDDTTDSNKVVTNVANIIGSNAYHVLVGLGSDSSAVLDGFRVTAGQANGSFPHYVGAGMWNEGLSSPTLRNTVFIGNVAQSGGGMYNWSSNPTLTNVTFTNNVADQGGGLANNFNSSPTLTGVSFTGNVANQDGGGLFNRSNCNPILSNVTFTANTAVDGGGIYDDTGSSPTITVAAFTSNIASNFGGGIYDNQGSPILLDVQFTGNQAVAGGGLYGYQSSPTLTDVTFSDNQSSFGGGMYNINNSTPVLTAVRFIGNQATHGGGLYNHTNSSGTVLKNVILSGNQADQGAGTYNYQSGGSMTNVSFTGNSASTGGGLINVFSSPTLVHVILWGNQATSVGDQIFNSSSTPTISYSDIQGSGGSSSWDGTLGTNGGGNIDADPRFVTPVDPLTAPTTTGDLHLQNGSPAIDTGNNSACPATDLDGVLRPIDGNLNSVATCDMGAYEKLIDLFLPLIMR